MKASHVYSHCVLLFIATSLLAMHTCRFPDVKFHSLDVGKSYSNTVTTTKPNPNPK